MATTDIGAVALASLFCGDSAVAAFNFTNARVAVGDSATPFVVTQTDLQATTNKLRKLVNVAPVRTANSIAYTSIFTTAEANFSWQEVGLFNAATGNTMATRRTVTGFPAVKPPTEQWELTLTVIVTPA